MTSTPKLVDRPTRRQLAYLRTLADPDRPDIRLPAHPPTSQPRDPTAQAGASEHAHRALDRAQGHRRCDRPRPRRRRRGAASGDRRLRLELPVVALDAIGRFALVAGD